MAGAHSTIHMDDRTGNKFVPGYSIYHLCYLLRFTNTVEQMQPCKLINTCAMHRRTDHAHSERIHPHIVLAKLGSQL